MIVRVELDTFTIKELIADAIKEKLGQDVKPEKIDMQVRTQSKPNGDWALGTVQVFAIIST